MHERLHRPSLEPDRFLRDKVKAGRLANAVNLPPDVEHLTTDRRPGFKRKGVEFPDHVVERAVPGSVNEVALEVGVGRLIHPDMRMAATMADGIAAELDRHSSHILNVALFREEIVVPVRRQHHEEATKAQILDTRLA